MKNTATFNWIIAGDDQLSIMCAEALIASGQRLLVFISQFAAAKQWAEQQKIICFSNFDQFLNSSLATEKIDFVFNIVHFNILPSAVINLPEKFAINYHDSLLPKYAGLHATSWALLNNESEHGISWHIITEQVDAGDILMQEKILIDENETAFSLNLKCHQQALVSFKKLLAILTSDKEIKLVKQDLSLRSYFGRYYPLPQAGLIDWYAKGEDISRLCRALDFGKQKNTLGSAKFLINSELYVVVKHDLQPSSSQKPGTVSRIDEQFIQIATAGNDIRLFEIKNSYGKTISILDFVNKHTIQIASDLNYLSTDDFQKVSQAIADISKHEHFWIKQFSRAESLAIPFALCQGKKRNAKSFAINQRVVATEALLKLIDSYQKNFSPEYIILSALLAYLFRLNNCDPFSVNFTHGELNKTYSHKFTGLLAQSLPLAINFNATNTFRMLLLNVCTLYEEIIKHKTFQNDIFTRYPEFNKPHFPVAIAFTDIENYALPQEHPLIFFIDKSSRQVSIYFIDGLYDTVERIINYFNNFVVSLLTHSADELRNLALLDDTEYKKVIFMWNQTQRGYPKNSLVHQLFEAQAIKTPNKVAVIFEGMKITYEELNQKSNKLAHQLSKLIGKTDAYIAIYQTRGIENIISVLAVLKSGNIYVPISVEAPPELIRNIIIDCRPAVILTGEELSKKIIDFSTEVNATIIKLDTDWQNIVKEDANNLKNISTEQKAYVMYTSGSTGNPKGVEITHQSLVNFLLAIRRQIHFTPDDVLLAITPITFDISGLDIYLPLINGAQLILANFDARLDPQQIAQLIDNYSITIMQATPVTWQMLVNMGWQNKTGMKMLCGGEGLSTQLAAQLYTANAPLWNLYGPTETTIWSTIYKIEQVNINRSLVPIGKPIDNTQIYILDRNLQPVPIGEPGELYIAGSGVAVGYLNNPQLTRESFVHDPFSNNNYTSMYKSGDLARWLEDGNLEFIARIDHQIKVRGLRIELGEIEAALLNYSGIKQAIVINDISDSSKTKLVAYLVLHKEFNFSREELLVYLNARLYKYMIPAYFIFMNNLPVNANGKIDKHALPKPTIRDLYYAQKLILPTNKEEQLLAEIWSNVLSIPIKEMGINDNFFELGGNSLLAIQVITRVNSLFFIKLDIRSLFEFPTIKQLIPLILAAKKNKSPIPLLSPVKESQPQLLSYNQMRLWFLNEFYANTAVYNLAVAWRLQGELDQVSLNKAIIELIKRQGVLRTIFLSLNGKAKQILLSADSIDFNLEIEELENNSTAKVKSRLKQLAAEPFRVNYEKLFRFRLLRLAENEHVLFICLHHIIADGWSFGILYRELSILYQACYNKTFISLPPLSAQYIDYSAWQHKAYEANDIAIYKKQKEYWKNQLKNLPALELPIDFSRPAIQTYNGSAIHFSISPDVTTVLRHFAKENNVTLFSVMLSAFSILLSKYTGQTDIAVGIPIANRNLQAVENIIGFFVNTLVIRLDLSLKQRIVDFLQSTQNTVLDAYANGDVPFERIIEVVQPERDQSRSPLFQTMFAFNNAIADGLNLPNITAQQLEIESSYAQLELICFLQEKEERVDGYMDYNTDLFTRNTVQRFIDNYLVLLAELTKNSKQSIEQIAILSAAEKKLLLIDWNNTKINYPKNKNLIQLFEEQVNKNPHKTALIYQSKVITYAELNSGANQLAHFIKKAVPESKAHIAIYLDRGIEIVICFLAVMKSGNVYIPIDKTAPLAQIEELINNSKISAMLTMKSFAEAINEPLKQTEAIIINLDEKAELINKEAINNLPAFSSDYLAYVLYTSGSTGKPKGVQIRHQSLVNLLLAMQQEVNFTEKDVLLAITPLTFDLSVPDIYLPLISGASFVLTDHWIRFNAQQVIEYIANYKITLMQATPVTWQMLVNFGWRNETAMKMICGGEGLSTQLATQLHATGAALWNFYGPTEATVWSTYYKVNSVDLSKPLVAIGKPLANVRVYVLNENKQLTPIGVPGELYIGGDGVAQGYLNNSELTNQRFLPDFFLPASTEQLYKTGDTVVWSATGELHFVGRADNQIKIRGHRIEAEAIESILIKHADIADCIILDKSPTKAHELVAYVTLKNKTFSLTKIRDYLSQQLPAYMIPTQFFAVSQFPLTFTGKIDRKAIPYLSDIRNLSAVNITNVVVQNKYEKMVIDIIKNSLSLGTVDPQSNFFDLGMNSLTLVEFSYAVSKVLKQQVNIIEIFTYPTVRSLVSHLIKGNDDQELHSIKQRADVKRARKIVKRRIDHV